MTPLHLFDAFGIELEYMIVDREALAVRPIADRVLAAALGHIGSDYAAGPIAWSNELVLHVIELKTNGPTPTLAGVADAFQADVRRIDRMLAAEGAMLLPTAMHPTMDPARDTRLWPHDWSEVYQAYDRIFGCRGHGWANLQATHLNLPFCGDDEFGRLHAAVRVVLPLLPGLAASSPVMDGRATGLLDNRLEVYRHNQERVPSIMGRIVPEPVFTAADYRREILEPAWRDIAPLDPSGCLRHEFLNSRGAIARFERGAIEIRVLDVQEAPLADLAQILLITAAVRALVEERHVAMAELRAFATEPLAELLLRAIRDAERARIDDARLLAAFGWQGGPCAIQELWRSIAATELRDLPASLSPLRAALAVQLDQGTLARRILAAMGRQPKAERIGEVYRELARCLREGRMFQA